MNKVRATSPRRVKVYTLEDDKWIDKGTGYCTGELGQDGTRPVFVVKSEQDAKATLLSSAIAGSTQYQRQQDTLIVWTEPRDGKDYALSFQEPEGCLSLCKFLVDLQHSVVPNISLVAVLSNGEDGEITEVIAGPVPQVRMPEKDNLVEVVELLNQGAKSAKFKETLVEFIETRGYVEQLCEVFRACEAAEDLANLHRLCDVVKLLVLYNEPQIFDRMLRERNFDAVLGMLEYDPEHPDMRSNYRACCEHTCQYKEVVPLADKAVRRAMARTMRLSFLKDVITLVRILDDTSMSCLTVQIQVNQEKVLQALARDSSFLETLFDDTMAARFAETVALVHRLVLVARKLQPATGSCFFRALCEHGLLRMVEQALRTPSQRAKGAEIILTIIEYDVALFVAESTGYNAALIDVLTDILLGHSSRSLRWQALEALKVLLDPSSLSQPSDTLSSSPRPGDPRDRAEQYVVSFYRKSADKLFLPLTKLGEKRVPVKRSETVVLNALCELVGFIAREHDIALSRPFILNHGLLRGVSNLMDPHNQWQLRVAALHCLKLIILLDDSSLSRHLADGDILDNFVAFAVETKDCSNLASSACINLLDLFGGQDNSISNFQMLRRYLIRKHGPELCQWKHAHELMDPALTEAEQGGSETNTDRSSLLLEDDKEADVSQAQPASELAHIDTSILLLSPGPRRHSFSDDSDDEPDAKRQATVEGRPRIELGQA